MALEAVSFVCVPRSVVWEPLTEEGDRAGRSLGKRPMLGS